MTCGIYRIENIVNGRYYIGSSIHIEERWKQHKKTSRRGSKYPLYAGIRKYGVDSFVLQILAECSREKLDSLEQDYLLRFTTDPKCYNISTNVYSPFRDKNIQQRLWGRPCTTGCRKKLQKAALRRYDIEGSKYPALIDKEGNKVPSGKNLRRLARQLNISAGNLCSLVKGRRKSVSGWRIL